MRKEPGRLPPPPGATPREGSYAHGIDLADVLTCWNVAVVGAIWAMEYTELTPGYSYPSLREVPLDQLRNGPLTTPVGTPRGVRLILSAAAARGVSLPDLPGATATAREWSAAERARNLALGDAEIEFESVRRRLVPEAASRLTSVYVADDSASGRSLILSMFTSVYIVTVRVSAAIRLTRADPVWFERYFREPRVEFAEAYWAGRAAPNTRGWEYLVEGEIELTDAAQLAYVRANGAHTPFLKSASR